MPSREEGGNHRSVSVAPISLGPRGGRVAAGGSRVPLCGGQLPVCMGHRSSGNRNRGASRLPASVGSRAAGDQPCCALKCTGMQGPQGHVDSGNEWHQWHQVSQSYGGEKGMGKQGESCTSDPVMPAFYSVVQRSQGMSLSDQNPKKKPTPTFSQNSS